MFVSGSSVKFQTQIFAHFLPPESRKDKMTPLLIKTLLPLINQLEKESILLLNALPKSDLNSALDHLWFAKSTQILSAIRSFKEAMDPKTYRGSLVAAQAYLKSRDCAVPGRYENKIRLSLGVQYFGETARFHELNRKLDILLKEVEAPKTSWWESIRSNWTQAVKSCTTLFTSASSSIYNHPKKVACGLLALQAAALFRLYRSPSLTVQGSTTSLSPFSLTDSSWNCGSQLFFGVSEAFLMQNPMFMATAGFSCLPCAASQLVDGRVPDLVADTISTIPFSRTINMTELFGGPVTDVGMLQTNGQPLPEWLFAGPKIVSHLDGDATDIAIKDNNLVLIADHDGSQLKIINVDDKTAPHVVDTVFISQPTRVTVSENFAYVLNNDGMHIINVTDSAHPFETGFFSTNSSVPQGIDVQNDVAYVTTYSLFDKGSFKILDVSNKTFPFKTSDYKVYRPWEVMVRDHIAFVADEVGQGVPSFNVKNITNPVVINYNTAPSPIRFALNGDFLYIASNDIGTTVTIRTIKGGLAGSFSAEGKNLVLKNNRIFIPSALGKITILDVNNPTHPLRIGNAITGGIDTRIAVRDQLMYAANQQSGLDIADLSFWQMTGFPQMPGEKYHLVVQAKDKSLKTVSKSFFLSTDSFPIASVSSLDTQSVLPGESLTVGLRSNYLFRDDDEKNTLNLRMTSEATDSLPPFMQFKINPFGRSSLPLPYANNIRDVAIQGSFAYVLEDYTKSLKIIDMSNTAHLTVRGSLSNVFSSSNHLALQDDFAYIADSWGGQVKIISVQDKDHPSSMGNFTISGPNSISVNEDFAYVGTTDGLTILNIKNKFQPTRVSNLTLSISAITVREDIVYGLSWVGSTTFLTTIDVSNKTNPISLNNFPLPSINPSLTSNLASNFAEKITIRNSIAHIVNGPYRTNSRLSIIDVSDSSFPRSIGNFLLPYLWAIDITGNLVYSQVFNGHKQNIEIYDVTNSTTLTPLGTISGSNFIVDDKKNLVYVIDDDGFKIFDTSAYQVTISPTPADVGNYHFDVIATDPDLGTASIPLEVRVLGAPKFNKPLPPQDGIIGQPFSSIPVPQETFLDPNGDAYTLSAKSVPPSFVFYPATAILSAVRIPEGPAAEYNVTILATKTDNVYNLPSAETSWLLRVHHAPIVNSIESFVANVNHSYSLTLPQGTFYHPDGFPLTISATGNPSWFPFNNQTLTFEGIPPQEEDLTITLEAKDDFGGKDSKSFHLLAEYFPQMIRLINTVFTAPGHPFTFDCSSIFSTNDKVLKYSATRTDGPFPEYVNFDPSYCEFDGIFPSPYTGNKDIPILLTATDSNHGYEQMPFNFTVIPYQELFNKTNPRGVTVTNRAPVLADFLMQQIFTAGTSRSFSIKNSFKDADNDPCVYDADFGDTNWLKIDRSEGIISGNPTDRDAAFYTDKRLTISVSATDPEGTKATGTFEVLLKGPSFYEKVFNAAALASSFLLGTYACMKKKYFLWNYCRQSQYRKDPLHVDAGQTGLSYQVNHPATEISSIVVTEIQGRCCFSKGSCCPTIFKNTKERSFSGGSKISPYEWLEYSPKSNQFQIVEGGPTENDLNKNIRVRVVGTDFRIMEEFFIYINDGDAITDFSGSSLDDVELKGKTRAILPSASFGSIQQSHSSSYSMSALSSTSLQRPLL